MPPDGPSIQLFRTIILICFVCNALNPHKSIVLIGILLCAITGFSQERELYDSLFSAGIKEYKAKNYSSAYQSFDAAYSLSKTLFTEKDTQMWDLTSWLSGSQRRLRNYDKAAFYKLEESKSAKAIFGASSSEYSDACDQLAVLYKSIGRYDESEKYFKISIEVISKLEGMERIPYGIRLNNLAGLYKDLGTYDKAIATYKIALDQIAIGYGKEHKYYGICLSNYAGMCVYEGDYEQALNLFNEALLIKENTSGKMSESYAGTLSDLGLLYHYMGEYKKAETYYLKSLKISESVLDKEDLSLANSKDKIASLYLDMGEKTEALELYKEAQEIYKKVLGKEHPRYAGSLKKIASVYAANGEIDKAVKYYETALEILKKAVGPENIQYAILSVNYAGVLLQNQDSKQALSLYESALSTLERYGGKEHWNYGVCVKGIAESYLALGKQEKSVKWFQVAHTNTLAQIKDIFTFRSERERKSFLETVERDFHQYQSANFNMLETPAELLEMNLNNQFVLKGLLLKSSKNILDALEGLNEDSIYNKISSFRSLKTNYSKLIEVPKEERVINADSIAEVINAKEVELVKEYSNRFGVESSFEKDWKQVQSKLNVDEIAIEFSHFVNYKFSKKTDQVFYVAYLISKQWDLPKMVYLFNENELLQLLKGQNANSLYNSRGAEIKTRDSLPFLNDSVSNMIFYNIKPYLKGVKRIYYSPDGILHQISFAALVDSGILLSDMYELIQLSSCYTLAKGITNPKPNDFLIIGGVKYDLDTVYMGYALGLRGKSDETEIDAEWHYLPGTKKELDTLQLLLSNSSKSVQTWTDLTATEESFKALGRSHQSPKILNIATHGFYFGKDEADFLDNDGTKYKRAKDPLLRTGLLLSGANYAWLNGEVLDNEEDGILTALEIANLDLNNTDMVILSACETALGDIDGQEGVYGLQRAFKMAGVDILVMSLWEVPDKETVEFMSLFYNKWLVGMDVRIAFNEAQSVMKLKYKNEPLKWAAFVLFE